MSVYIKGMEMPKTCCYCPLMGYDPDREWFDNMAQTGAHICALTGELIDNTKRAEHCPLIPVPDHGRLIDADELDAYLKTAAITADGEAKYAYIDARAEAKTMPTIIPADKEETE